MNAGVAERILDNVVIRELARRIDDLRLDMDRQGAHFIRHIDSDEDYEKALAAIDELTDGQELDRVEQTLLDTLCDTVERYESSAVRFKAFDERGAALTGVDLVRALMIQNGLTGTDLPEIGDKTVVSRILSGQRKLTVQMITRLSARFHIEPSAFLATVN
ncbi:MAG: XRE family transcriptional regulator [Pseudomonas sp.]|jgi:HTH-type transcriptional regulator/antitoxin HigA|uniref:helix-turn-helix domain-containing protein n=1 Tax=Pseudomonas sp. TaxID=306 RepID=UPI0023956A72|nr:XRE family transcriptional regulator [Pseudomonas sp.]MDE1197062.1 XRE family transcriptional regulator [Pseudomonas sp.]